MCDTQDGKYDWSGWRQFGDHLLVLLAVLRYGDKPVGTSSIVDEFRFLTCSVVEQILRNLEQADLVQDISSAGGLAWRGVSGVIECTCADIADRLHARLGLQFSDETVSEGDVPHAEVRHQLESLTQEAVRHAWRDLRLADMINRGH
jgi:DNA-binding IscR family transcriptional regulator